MSESFEQKNVRNRRVSARYDELMREGKHGHYETMFRVVREEVERERKAISDRLDRLEAAVLELNPGLNWQDGQSESATK